MAFSVVTSSGVVVTYLIDMHDSNALHVLSITNFAKNLILYGLTLSANGVVVSRGVKTSLFILGGCQSICRTVSVPMYVYGKLCAVVYEW